MDRGLARRQAFLDAAAELFLEKGYERTSLSDIVHRSKGSRTTLYEQFGGKEGLLRAMIEETTGRIREDMAWEEQTPSLTIEGLERLALRFLKTGLAPRVMAVYRIVVAEGHRFPETARLFYDAGPRQAIQRLAIWFTEAIERSGTPAAATPEELAHLFFGAVLADIHVQEAIGLPSSWTERQMEEHVRVTARIILQGLGLNQG